MDTGLPDGAPASGRSASGPAPWRLGLLVGGLAVLAVLGQLAQSGWNPHAFVGFGSHYAAADEVPAEWLVQAAPGYDGQFFFRLALDPFTTRAVDFGLRLDSPPYRQQRILYPLLAHLAAGGRATRVAWTLIAVNVAGLALIGALGAALCRRRGVPTTRGLLFALLPGGVLALQRDLADVTSVCCLLAALLALEHHRVLWASLALGLAVLARETTWVACAALATYWVWRRARPSHHRRPDLRQLVPALAPTLILAAWQAHLLGVWGQIPIRSGGGNLSPPLAGIFRQFAGLGRTGPSSQEMTFALELAAVVVVALWALRSSRSPSFEKWGFVVSLVLLCSLSGDVWAHFAGYLRASGETLVFAVAVLIGARTRVLFWASVPLITLSVHLAVKEMAPVVGVVLGIAIAVTAAATARGALAQRGAARA